MLLQIEPGLIIWTAVTFVALLIVLRAFVWKPLLKALDEREERIKGSLEGAERARAEAEAALEQHRKALAAAEAETQEIINRGREAAERMRQDIVQEAQTRAQQLLEQARRQIGAEKDAALVVLRGEIANLAIQAAGKILDANLDETKHRQFIDDFIDRIPASHN